LRSARRSAISVNGNKYFITGLLCGIAASAAVISVP
jgi:hypothetical protein